MSFIEITVSNGIQNVKQRKRIINTNWIMYLEPVLDHQ